jgi:hypothetical protein
MTLQYNVTLPSVETIERAALKALRSSLNGMLTRSAAKIALKLKAMIRKAIQLTPEYQSINGGRLQAELGLADPKKLDQIIDLWVDSVKVEVKRVRFGRNKITGGFRITAIEQDWSDALANPASKQQIKDGELPWLEWMLIRGDQVIVRDYDVSFNPKAARRGRTGRGLMVKGKGRRWRVPPQFSGTPRRNFVTRALDSIQRQVETMITKEVLRQVK